MEGVCTGADRRTVEAALRQTDQEKLAELRKLIDADYRLAFT
jgi:hypothetical protein